jgi:hypothetical protein
MGILRFFEQFKQILITPTFLFIAITAMPQAKSKPPATQPVQVKHTSIQLRDFYNLAAESGVQFVFPPEFKEKKVLNNEDFSFDYAMEIPGHDFEIWFQLRSQKKDWAAYELSKNNPKNQLENPDSSYVKMGQAQAAAFSDDNTYSARIISPDILARYRATSGKSYLVNLPDQPETGHYRYALILTLQRDHIGRVLAICFTNDKNPDFFRHVNRMSQFIRFKP